METDIDKEKRSYQQELDKRLRMWVAMNKTRISLMILGFVIGHILLYFYFVFVAGRQYAVQNLFQIISGVILVDLVLGISGYVYIAYHKISEEIYNDQEDYKKKLETALEELKIQISSHRAQSVKAKIRFEEYPQNKSVEPHLSLKVFNDEKTDLTQCYPTLLELILFYTPDKPINIREEVNPNNLNLTWGGGSSGEYITIPRNGDHKVLNICKLTGAGLVFLFRGHEKPYSIHGKFMAKVAINGFLGDKPIEPKTVEFCFEHGLPYNISQERQEEPEVGVRQNIVIQVSSTKEMFTFLDCPNNEKVET